MMKFSSILLSSVTLLVAGVAYAADLPAKKAAPAVAAPSGACPAYGAGFIAIPGTDSCLNINGYMRSDNKYTSNVARPAKSPYNFGYKFIARVDVRNNTEVGTVRSVIGLIAVDGTTGTVPGSTVMTESAYVDVGGFRAGAAPSPVDFDNAYNNSGVSYQPTQVALISYTGTVGATSFTLGAQAAENNNDAGLTTATANTQASRPDLLIAATSKLGDAVTLKGGLVSHEVDGSVTGTAQGFAAIGRADIAFAPIKVIVGGAYANGANSYVDNAAGSAINGQFNSVMGGKVKDSASDASNLATASDFYGAVEYSLGSHVLYAFADSETGTQDTNSYKRSDYGIGFKYQAAKGLYIRPELYQKTENANAASDTISNVFYLRIRRDF